MSNTAWKPESNPPAALRAIIAALRAGGITSAEAEARQLLAAFVTEPLILAPALTAGQQRQIGEIITARRAGKPLQHLLGEMTFCHLQLKSDRRALIVRPETELLASWAIAELSEVAADCRHVVDVGTGSGNLALAIATSVPSAVVTAIDVSEAALALAEENIARHHQALQARGSHIELVCADVREIGDLAAASVVVANPPYLPAGEAVHGEVCFDPALALYGGGAAGLQIPEATVAFAARTLGEAGVLLLEHHHTQAAALRHHARSCGFSDARTRHDMAGRPRFLQARMCQAAPNRGKIEA